MRLESYTHKFAKEVLREWLYSGKIANIHCSCPEVYLEYSVVNNYKYNSVERLWNLAGNKNPTFDECFKAGIYPKRVIDVVLVCSGKPLYFIEVKHKCSVSTEKIKDLKKLGIKNLLEIDASWIMKQVGPPKYLHYKQLIKN